MTSPFHAGEQRVQTRLGVRAEIEPWARRVVRPTLPDEHRAFYAQLPFLVAAARDGQGRPWATLLAGEAGFASSPDEGTLQIAALPSRDDALADALAPGDDLGLLGIELHTRRRNRVNGRVAERSTEGLALAVAQSFGNCPQYITERSWQRAAPRAKGEPARRGTELSASQRRQVGLSDTFFIATGYREPGADSESFGMDASHRGGAPGFVHVLDGQRLVFPDYAGNNHFNTLGNLLLDPQVGLLFVDFERGDLLQITGRATIDWDSDAVARFPGARRLVAIEIDETIELRGVLPLRWSSSGEGLRELRVVDKVRESDDVTSLVLAAADGDPLPGFAAGQHLPVALEVPGQAAPVVRTWSLSNAPGDPHYRVTVKRHEQGVASRHLHDELEVGDAVSAREPRGDFVLDPSSTRPVVLASSGVGLTPLVSMLHELAGEPDRAVWFVHGARDGRHHPLRHEVESLTAGAPHVKLHTAYSRPRPGDTPGHDFDVEGRVDTALLEKLVPGLEADFYLCGPVGFMASLRSGLESRGVPPERIRSESFGPAA